MWAAWHPAGRDQAGDRRQRRPHRSRPRSHQQEIGIVDQVPFSVDHRLAQVAQGARRAPRTATAGSTRARASRTSRSTGRWTRSRPARCPRERPSDAAPSTFATAAALASSSQRRGAARAEKPQIVFPQGSEQPLAALQDIDVIEHLGDAPRRAGVHRRGRPLGPAGLAVRPRQAGGGHAGLPRCPMLCGLVLDGLVKAASQLGLELGKDFLAVDVSIDPGEDTKLLTADPAAACWSWSVAARRPPTGRSGVHGRRRRRRAAARRRRGLPLQVRRHQQAVRARRGRLRADAGRDHLALPVRRRLSAAGLSPGGRRGGRRPGRHVVRQGAPVLLPVRPRDPAVRAVR